jgi:hypothetical protein
LFIKKHAYHSKAEVKEWCNCQQPVKGPWHRLSRVHRDILIFTSSALKTWVLHVNTFYSWILLYISLLTYLYFPYHCISLIYFSFTMIRMFLYAQIYWLAEFGDVSPRPFHWLLTVAGLRYRVRLLFYVFAKCRANEPG